MYTLNEVKKRAKRENDEKNKRLHFFGSRFSIYFSWVFINLGISANGVTGIFFIVGLLGAVLFLSNEFLYMLLAYGLWRLHIIFDICDGEVARFTQKFSINGAYWDYMIHAILYPLTFVSMSIAMYFKFNDVYFLFIGLFGSIVVSQMLSVKNNYYRAMLFNNLSLDKKKGENMISNKKFVIYNSVMLILSFEGFLFFYLCLNFLVNVKSYYLIFFMFYILVFFSVSIMKFYLFSKNGFYMKRS